MNAIEKRRAALALLAGTGIWKSNYAPPLLEILWRFGLNIPPPHFIGFWRNCITFGGIFAVLWGAAMGFINYRVFLVSPGPIVFTACCVGILFGLFMASYYAWGARRHGIPRWDRFEGSPDGASPTDSA